MATESNVSTREQLEEVIEQFELAWQTGPPPTLEAFLANTRVERALLLRELVHTDLEYRLRAGEPARVEEYLERFPELQNDADEVIELLVAEHRHRQQRGEQPTASEYQERFPHYRGLLLQTPVATPEPTEVAPGAAGRAAALPAHVGRYRVGRYVNRGGMADIYRVEDSEFNRPLAMKVLQGQYRDDSTLVDRFQREAQLTGQLQHPGIPPVQDKGRLPDGRPYFIMKLVKGRSLQQLLRQRATPSDRGPYFLGVFEQICQTVAYAHTRGVIHRDLKPGNVMVGAFGEVQVMDWGLAKVLGPGQPAMDKVLAEPTTTIFKLRGPALADASVAGTVLGTPAYMSPEQARGEVEKIDRGCDVFGLGGILCDILTGKPPFAAATAFENQRLAMNGDLSETFARLDTCGADAELIALAKHCLAAQPQQRPGEAGAVAQAVAAYQDLVRERLRQAEVAKGQAEVRAVEERKRRRLHLALAASVLVLVCLTGAGGWWAQQLLADQAARRQEASRQELETRMAVDAILNDVTGHQQRSEWPEARAALERAAGRLGEGGPEDLRQRLKQARADLELIVRLDDIRQRRANQVKDDTFDSAFTPAAMASALRDHGFAVADSGRLAEQIRASAIQAQLVAALDEWAWFAPDPAERNRLLALARQLDPHPWRDRFRDLAAWKDQQVLERLAAEAPLPELTPFTLAILAAALARTGGDQETLLRRAQRQYPDDFWINFDLALLLNKKRLSGEAELRAREEVIGFHRAALAARPRSSLACTHLGVALCKHGKHLEAESMLRAAIRLQPDNTLAYLELSWCLIQHKDYDKAEAVCRELIKRREDYHRIYINLSSALSGQRKLAEAEAACRTAIKLRWDYGHSWSRLGWVLSQKEEYSEAEAAFREAIRLDPQLADARVGLEQAAIAALKKTARLDPTDDAKRSNKLGLALRIKGDLEGAIAAYQEATRLDPKYATAHYNLGVALRRKGDLEGAIAAYKEAIRLNPKYAKAHSGLGLALRSKGELEDAIAAYQEAIRLDRKYATAHDNLSVALRAKGDLKGAIAASKKAIALDRYDAIARDHLGLALRANGQLDAAIAAYNKAIDLDPKDAKPHNHLGTALREKGDLAGAVAAHKEAVRLDPKYALAHAQLALALDQQHRFHESVHAYQAAFDADSKLADNLRVGHRFSAARAAVLAAAGQDAANLPADQRVKLRQKASNWLRAELAAWAWDKLLQANAEIAAAMQKTLHDWKNSAELASVRDEKELANLPYAERQAWRQFWADVDTVIKRAEKEVSGAK
jgi:serine/threonine-protein kinase